MSDEALVNRAARAMHDDDFKHQWIDTPVWEELNPDQQADYERLATVALRAFREVAS